MPSHVWNCSNDFEYCELSGCVADGDSVKLDGALNGTILSDIRHSTDKHWKYDAVKHTASIPAGTTLTLSYRSGFTSKYIAEAWSDWIVHGAPERRVEYTVSLTDVRIMADYAIGTLLNIYTEQDYRYKILWSALTDMAVVDYARVDYDPGEVTGYASGASIAGNMVTLLNPLPDNNANVMLEYIPRNVIYNDIAPYIQWKAVMTSDETGKSPVLRRVQIDNTLRFGKDIYSAFPGLFRRL